MLNACCLCIVFYCMPSFKLYLNFLLYFPIPIFNLSCVFLEAALGEWGLTLKIQKYMYSVLMWMTVTVFQSKPQVYFPRVLDVLYLLGGKQNEKQNLIHAGKIYLCHFMPFARGAKCFSHWFYIAFSSNFCWSVSKDISYQLWFYISQACLGFIGNLTRGSRFDDTWVICSSLL